MLVAAVVSGLVAASASPALADDPDPDTTAPVIVDLGVQPGQLIPRRFRFEPVVTDDVGVVKIEGLLGGLRDHVFCGAVSCTVETTNRVQHDAELPLSLWAIDAAGNRSEVVTTTVRIDKEIGPVTLSPPVNSILPSGPVTVRLSGMADDIVKVEMTSLFDGGEVLATRTEAPWEFTWNAVGGTTRPHFRLTDRAGNTGIQDSRYVVDAEAPVIERVDSVSAYSPGRVDLGGAWVGQVSRLRAVIRDKSRIARYEWRVDGRIVSSDPTLSWVPANHPAATADISLQVWDPFGYTASTSFTVNLDKDAPAMTVYPAEGALIRGATFRTGVKATDAHGVAYVALQAPDNPAGSRADAHTVSSGRDGKRQITWLSVDNLGNARFVWRTVIVDNTAPSVAYRKAPKNLAKLKARTTLTATAADRNGIARVQLLVDGKVVATDTNATYTFTLNPKKYGKRFTVQLRAYDKAGNVKYTTKRVYRR
ncbi:Ig-like domain-containing protein [Actinoplanes flavus]|uniref:Ig-like domain repeat protein n=1 Tax=Actinoplanes flavus TaxID=2820290 RepID=A0ABS3UJ23_9ACTN|nr:Ig-like domain-containing protein [Actinoplanes flavus]MBO3738789.1 Ig-like domain repeat protein [Actinoplanes flavus]